MPKKNSTTRGGGQRNRAHAQKSIALVRPTSELQEQEELNASEQVPTAISTSTIEPETPATQKQEHPAKSNGNGNGNGVLANTGVKVGRSRTRGAALVTPSDAVKSEEAVGEEDTLVTASPATAAASVAPAATAVTSAPKGSAAARIAARRQAAQKSQQRAAVSLITPEHYSYVRKDLRFILILAIIMFAVIIILHFVLPHFLPGVGY